MLYTFIGENSKMDRYVIQFPDQRLTKQCDKVSDFGLAKKIVDKMISVSFKIRSEIYQYPRGFEIAAPQIDEPYRIIILQSDYCEDSTQIETAVMVNPEIVSVNEGFYNWEDCLSVKDMRGFVKRFNQIQVNYQDIDGNLHERRVFRGNFACDVQHGTDHLNGILYFERDMKYFIPWSVYRPLKEQDADVLNSYVIATYRHFNHKQYFNQKIMDEFGLIHPRQCLKISDNF